MAVIKVKVTDVTDHEDGAYLGLVVSYPRAGWMRFAATVLVMNDISDDEAAILTRALSRRRPNPHKPPLDVPLFDSESWT